MGLRDLRRQVALAVLAKRVADRLRKEQEMGRLKPAIVGLGGGIVTAILANIWSACPDLKAQLVAIGFAAVGGAVATYMIRPKQAAGLKATLAGIGTLILGGIVTRVTAICPDLIAQLPALAMSGVTVGIGLWLRSHREPPK